MPRAPSKPRYSLHRPSGQARCRIGGRDIYLGPYGSPESYSRFDDLIREWNLRQSSERVTMRVEDLTLAYLDHAGTHYVKDGEPTSELSCLRIALRHLVQVYGRCRVLDFGPLKLAEVRQAMIEAGYGRKSINIHIGRIRRMFRWAVAREMIPVTTYQALAALPGLEYGRTKARETPEVEPVSDAAIEAVEPHVSRQVWALIQIQRLSGARPGEVCQMRGCDLNMAGPAWEFSPASHKSQHRGKRRVIFLGPRAQAIVREFLKADLQAYLFSPADARAEFDRRRRENRKSKITPSQAARSPKDDPAKKPADRYTVCSYGQAVRKACEQAFGMPLELRNVERTIRAQGLTGKAAAAERERLKAAARAWRQANCWHPHQLRHSAATDLRRQFGIESARVVLGHASAVTSEIYAEKDLAAARDVMARIG